MASAYSQKSDAIALKMRTEERRSTGRILEKSLHPVDSMGEAM